MQSLLIRGLCVRERLNKWLHICAKMALKQLHVIDASQLFLKRLKGISDPEQKRKIIGHSFIEVFEKAIKNELKKYTDAYLAHGTIYPRPHRIRINIKNSGKNQKPP